MQIVILIFLLLLSHIFPFYDHPVMKEKEEEDQGAKADELQDGEYHVMLF